VPALDVNVGDGCCIFRCGAAYHAEVYCSSSLG
jgi:hypothetical protein